MFVDKESEKIGIYIALLAACTTLAISPMYSYDAFTPLKLTFLSALGSISAFYFVRNFKNLPIKIGKFATTVTVCLLINSLIILAMSKIAFVQAFYGISGRYTGFLTYISLILALIASAIVTSFSVRKKVLNFLLFCGVLSVIYSLIQYSGEDFFDWDSTSGSQVIGFLGNPNFLSSFLALIATAVFAKLIYGKKSLVLTFFYLSVIIGAILGLRGANSTQGFLLIVLGFAIVIYFYVKFKFRSRILSRVVLFGSFAGIVGGLLDIFQKSPWDPFLYGETISFRGDFWEAGWNMTLSNPFFGVGFDGYLNHYRRSRDFITASRPSADVPTDSAHNVLLDYASNGGFMFLIFNLILLGLILKSGLQYLRKMDEFDPNFVAIFAIWIGFTVQSIISINQLGLVVWGWVFGGLILGAKYKEDDIGKLRLNNSNLSRKKTGVDGFTTVVAIIGLLGGMIAWPILRADHQFKLAIDSKKALALYDAANSWPPITKKMILVTAVLDQNKIYKEAKILSQRTVQISPDSFEAWMIYANNPLVTDSEMVEIKKQLLRLDPNITKLGGIDKFLAEKLVNRTDQ